MELPTMLYSSLEARLSALLFVLSSFLYLTTSWLLWPIIIQVPTSYTGGPQKFPFSCFAEQFFSTPWLDLDLQSGHSLLSAKLLLTFFNWLTAQTLLLCYIYYSKKWIFSTLVIIHGRSNATQDIPMESTYCNLQDEWHVKKIRETLNSS